MKCFDTEPIIIQPTAAKERLRCEKLIRIVDGYDHQGGLRSHHERCGQPAREVSLEGLLTSANAILCDVHAEAARRETWVSRKGYTYRAKSGKRDEEPLLPFRK